MFVLWPNVTVIVCGGIVLATICFLVYGSIKGFDKTFSDD
jgi:hypothetical protein